MSQQVDSIHIIRGNLNIKGEIKMYIKDNEPKYFENESNAPEGWITSKIIIRENDKIKEVKIEDDEER